MLRILAKTKNHKYITGTPLMTFLALGLLFSSCIREELPVPRFDRGSTQTLTISIGSDYGQQVWYSLRSNEIVKVNPKTDWELAFDTRQGHPQIYLNSSLLMQAAVTSDTDLLTSSRPPRTAFRPDHPSGHPDSLMISDWQKTDGVIWLDLGFDPLGKSRGFRKMIIKKTSDDKPRLIFMAENGSPDTLTIDLDSRSDRQMISLTDRTSVDIEPASQSWDLLFTQYTQLFYDPYTPYLVVGILNSPHLKVHKMKDRPFGQISREEVEGLDFSTAQDAIGYDWKTFDFDTGVFQIGPDVVYIIEDGAGFLYKLTFLDFYDDQGVRGSPTFQVELL